jgi:hypothetical protein
MHTARRKHALHVAVGHDGQAEAEAAVILINRLGLDLACHLAVAAGVVASAASKTAFFLFAATGLTEVVPVQRGGRSRFVCCRPVFAFAWEPSRTSVRLRWNVSPNRYDVRVNEIRLVIIRKEGR